MIARWEVTPERAELHAKLKAWLAEVQVGTNAAKIFIVSGTPGTGKSHLLDYLLEALTAKALEGIKSCADCGGWMFKKVERHGPRGQADVFTECGCVRRLRPIKVTMHPDHRTGTPGLLDLFAEMATMDGRREHRPLLAKLATTRLLAIDDLGAERSSPPTFEPGLIGLLDSRTAGGVLITSNLTDTQMAERYDARLVDRLLGSSVSIYYRLDAPSWRNGGGK